MSESTIDLEDLSRLNLTQNVRRQIITEMTANGKLPEDKDDRAFLLEAMNGMDRTVLTKARIKNDEKAMQTQAQATAVIANLLTAVTASAMKGTANRNGAPVLEKDITPGVIIEGETAIGVQNLDYDTFMKQMSQ